MRKLQYLFLTMVVFVISGCMLPVLDYSDPETQTGEKMNQSVNEYKGPHYAKLNSIGCLQYGDMEIAKSGDFDTVDNLIRAQRCFVIPTDTDVYIKECVKGDILSAKLRGSRQLFYTVKNNLVSK